MFAILNPFPPLVSASDWLVITSSSLIGRKARKEAYTLSKRVEDFASENLFILGGFTGFYLLGKPCDGRKICIFKILILPHL
jgi:hypothetical protein